MKRLLLIAACVVGMGVSVKADSITITPSTQVKWQGTSLENPDAAFVATKVGYGGTLSLLYKIDVDGHVEGGTYAGSYSTAFYNPPDDPSDATITWEGGTAPNIPDGNPLYLVVKDGNNVPYWYIFDLRSLDLDGNGTFEYSWDGKDAIQLEAFWPDNGAISHIDIYGVAVPDSGLTAAMLGLGVLGVGYMARRKS